MRKRRHTGGFARDLMFGYTPLLQNYTVNISRQHETTHGGNVSISLHREQIQQMIDIFSKGGRQNVALIGPDGCGRSTIVNEFASEILNADNKISSQIKYRQVFKLDAAALISSASERGEMETLMNRILNEAYYAKNVILWLENAELFFEEGTGSIDISNVLLPILENGAVRVILTMDQQKGAAHAPQHQGRINGRHQVGVRQSRHKRRYAEKQYAGHAHRDQGGDRMRQHVVKKHGIYEIQPRHRLKAGKR
jgi:ATP-dependent Clp protease ATP-binding subunit ClpA